MRTLLIATGVAASLHFGIAAAEEAKKEAAPAAEEKAPAADEKAAEKKPDVEVTVEGNDTMQFDKKEFTVKAGQTVALTFKNVGKLPKVAMGHNLVILKPGTDVAVFATDCMANAQTTGQPVKAELKEKMVASTEKILGPGEEEVITFTAPEAGKYDYICTFTGHFAVMKGVMTVEAAE